MRTLIKIIVFLTLPLWIIAGLAVVALFWLAQFIQEAWQDVSVIIDTEFPPKQ